MPTFCRHGTSQNRADGADHKLKIRIGYPRKYITSGDEDHWHFRLLSLLKHVYVYISMQSFLNLLKLEQLEIIIIECYDLKIRLLLTTVSYVRNLTNIS